MRRPRRQCRPTLSWTVANTPRSHGRPTRRRTFNAHAIRAQLLARTDDDVGGLSAATYPDLRAELKNDVRTVTTTGTLDAIYAEAEGAIRCRRSCPKRRTRRRRSTASARSDTQPRAFYTLRHLLESGTAHHRAGPRGGSHAFPLRPVRRGKSSGRRGAVRFPRQRRRHGAAGVTWARFWQSKPGGFCNALDHKREHAAVSGEPEKACTGAGACARPEQLHGRRDGVVIRADLGSSRTSAQWASSG